MSLIIAPKFKLTTLQDVLTEDIHDLHSAETSQVKALGKMAAAATHELLKKLFNKHLAAAQTHVGRLEQAAKSLGISPQGKHCSGMMGIILDLEVMMRSQPSGIRDIQLVCAAQKMTHYKLVGYSSVCAVAKLLKADEVSKVLQATLAEENAINAELSALGDDSLGGQFESRGKPLLARKVV
jgi:ferritin-like metal-binding protein YciE